MAITLDGTNGITTPDVNSDGLTVDTTTLVVDEANNRVGIGTSSPLRKFHVSSSEVVAGILESTNTYSMLRFLDSVNTVQASAAGIGSTGTELALYSNGAERARIDSSGNLLVGTSSSSTAGEGFKAIYNGGTNPYTLSVMSSSSNSQLTYWLYSTGAGASRFYVGCGGTVYATNTSISAISDQRHKENIQDLDVGLDAIMSLKPRKFDWKAGKGKDIKNDRGFIAQEFEQVFPDLIDEWKDPAPEGEEPYKSVRQDLIPVLVKAIQEQQELITAQQTALQEALTKIETLEARVAALEAA